MRKSTTPKGVASSLALLPRVGSLHLPTLRYRKYNPDGVMAHRVVWWRLVGAVPVYPPCRPTRAHPSLKSPHTMRVFLVWKRRCANVRAGTQAPPLQFRLDGLRVEWLISFGWIVCKWLFCLCGIAWQNITERSRGSACVPARVAPQGHIRRSSPAHNACIFGMETPLHGCSGGHTGAAPTISFGQIAHETVDFVWMDCVQIVILFV